MAEPMLVLRWMCFQYLRCFAWGALGRKAYMAAIAEISSAKGRKRVTKVYQALLACQTDAHSRRRMEQIKSSCTGFQILDCACLLCCTEAKESVFVNGRSPGSSSVTHVPAALAEAQGFKHAKTQMAVMGSHM